MDFEFSSDSLMLRDMVRRFVQKEARPLEMGYFTRGLLSAEESARLRSAVDQMGLWGLLVPERYGGGGLDLVSACLVEMELGATFVPVEIGMVPPALFACAGEQVTRFLEPALAGEMHVHVAARETSGLAPETWSMLATPSEAGFRLAGVKLVSRQPAPQDVLLTLAKAPQGPTAFLIDAAQVMVNGSVKDGLSIELRGLEVGRDRVLGDLGAALKLGGEAAPRGWTLTGARYLGMVERLVEMGAEHARDWLSLGAPLAVRPALRGMLADLRSELEAARWLVFHAAWCVDQNQPAKMEAALVRLRTGELLKSAVDRVTMVFGGPGPIPQIEPRRMVHAFAPPQVLEFALDQARAFVAAEVMAAVGGR
jgi:acyl-CoA dehydrogenase